MQKKLVVTLGLSVIALLSIPSALAAHSGVAQVTLKPTPLAINAGLENASGRASVRIHRGTLVVSVDLGGAMLPQGAVLEGWVVDPGLQGGPGGASATSVSDDDEIYGTPFGDANFDMMVDNSPYALSTGVLKEVGNGVYQGRFKIANDLTPYNVLVITLEADGNRGDYDPRPGTPVLAGEF